jgi:hypothetical protein
MSKFEKRPAKLSANVPNNVPEKMHERIRRAIVPMEQADAMPAHPNVMGPAPGGFFSFRYSSTEISTQGGNIHVTMKETRYQDGRLLSEECEGTLDRHAYERMVSEAQGYFLGQMVNFVRLLYSPFSSRGRRYDE